MRITSGKLLLLLGAAIIPLAWLAARGERETIEQERASLSLREQALARRLAEEELLKPEHGIAAGERIYFTRVNLIPAPNADSPQREAIVTHYRYEGNQAILTYVDLRSESVYKVEKVTNLPTPLSEEEYRLAIELARADPRLAGFFADHEPDLQIDAKLCWPSEVRDSTQPHRNVELIFRDDDGWLVEPLVWVDLVRRIVHVDEPIE